MERDFYIFSLYPFQKTSETCLQFPCSSQMSVSLAVSSSKNHIKQTGFRGHIKHATNMNFMMKCSTFVMTFSDYSIQLTSSVNGAAGTAFSNVLSLKWRWLKRHSISMTDVPEDVRAHCTAGVRVNTITTAMKNYFTGKFMSVYHWSHSCGVISSWLCVWIRSGFLSIHCSVKDVSAIDLSLYIIS